MSRPPARVRELEQKLARVNRVIIYCYEFIEGFKAKRDRWQAELDRLKAQEQP